MIDPHIRERWELAAQGKAEAFEQAAGGFTDLLKLMADLRSLQGCPWDREQSLASLRQYVREEAEEICHAVDEILAYEAGLRERAGLNAANPEPPEGDDKARTEKKGWTIAHHPHRADFKPEASASGAPLPDDLTPEERAELDRRYYELRKELGDLLLQPAFMGDILLAMGRGGTEASLEALLTKLIRRHPHVYGSVVVADSAGVLANWERIKQAERDHSE
jgi:NTP pyrophosphatase (non-canonical NTP hydrolase)